MSSFEDLNVWRKAKTLAIAVSREVASSKNFALRDQMIRSAISVPSNIAEGAERSGKKEFANFLSYALGSNAELITQIMIAKELKEIDSLIADSFIADGREIGRMLHGLHTSLAKQPSN